MAVFVTVLFFVSGLVALAYEVVWVRALGLVVGASLWATVAVVAAYMGGMALGNALVARFADRIRAHLRLYGLAEGLAAVTALATAPVLGVLTGAAAHLGAAPLSGWGLPLAGRFLLSWGFLLLPTVAMGATLPLLVERVGGSAALSRRVGRLYAANTLGAVGGVVLSGFIGLPLLGERGTLTVAALLGLAVAAVAWLAEGSVPRPAAAAAAPPAGARARAWLVYPALFGFVALACELVWTRVLLLHLGSRVYAFAVILAVYLAGIGLGAAAVRFLGGEPRRALAVTQGLLGLVLALQVPAFARFGDVLAWVSVNLKPVGFVGLQASLALSVAAVLLPPTLLFGASFPLAVAAYPGRGGHAARTGAVGAANTLGGIAGAIAGPLVLVPLVGSQLALLLLGGVAAAAGLVLGGSRPAHALAGAALAVIAATAAFTPADAVLRGAAVVSEGAVETVRESASATVVVRRIADARGTWRSLELNGVNVAGTSPELRAIQRLQGHLPLLLARDPRRVLHIGFGSGGTAWAVAQHPVSEIVIAEISPEVLQVSGSVFGDVNHGVLADPRVRVVLNDGRNALLAMKERFDAILSDSIHPVYAGNSTLYTREYFQLCRRRLAPGGVVSMWLPMYSLSTDSYLGILRAFCDVFPSAAVWYDPIVLNEFTVVTGSAEPGPLKLHWESIGDPALAGTLAEAGIGTPYDLAAMLLLGPREVAMLAGEAPAHIDDLPEVEYRSGRLLDREASWADNFLELYAARARANPFAAFPGDWGAVVTARDAVLRAELRQLKARMAAR
jgi:spermidine synthase